MDGGVFLLGLPYDLQIREEYELHYWSRVPTTTQILALT